MPAPAIPLERIKVTLRGIFEQYGVSPLDTPAIEREEVLAAKYAGGSEILKEMFTLQDQGGRKLALRYDHTGPLARVRSMNPQLKKPFKRYVMDKSWRDGPVSMGRFREFLQCDVDIVGVAGSTAEIEILKLSERVMKTFGLSYKIRINDRRILEQLLKSYKIKAIEQSMLTLDKSDKLSTQALVDELRSIDDNLVNLWNDIQTFDSQQAMLDYVQQHVPDDVVKDMISILVQTGEQVVFDLTLVRGLSYYTSTVFEIILTDSDMTSSVGGGGRYDDMIGKYQKSKEQVPAIGISFGLSRILAAQGGASDTKTVTQAFVIPVKVPFADCMTVAEQLRDAGICTEVDLVGRSISKNMNYCNALGITFALIIGEDEYKQGKVTLKHMESDEQETLVIADALNKIKATLKP
jgi:histidyl-tRNA synthetase